MSSNELQLLWVGLGETLYMTGIALVLSYIFGLPLGVILVTTEKGHIWESPLLNRTLGAIVNATRSIPFIILLVAVIPLTRLLVGTSIGTTAATVPLVIGAVPFVGRMVETSLKEVDRGLVEAALAMGATPLQIIFKVLLPESIPSLILGATITAITLIGYSAMAGFVGGGGLGDLAVKYGYYRYKTEIMLATIAVLVILVQVIQSFGNYLAKLYNKKHK
ncbi:MULTISPECIES: methionine ABC transporter permease [unclassified Carboxydocella]|uniref:methionine ABC transporter permease n=1 Tax=unclassified Carboxydocella TaxID=2685367 RepID=UPI0009AE8979|nr:MULTISPECIES: methionine ABC transporter permease [unclassified Carboxydocella]AVX30714.1 D-methionine transport system permease protein [Carboxydocella thermautotrophica]GAW30139.1 methionine ABC transporter permease [Carboxydocella sp. ULO1]GAW31118.1 methionine ABC transporter permease [Carboxydocella sp. JDF658]